MILSKTKPKKKQLKRINKKGFGGNCFHHIHLILIIFYVMHILFEKKMKKKKDILLLNNISKYI